MVKDRHSQIDHENFEIKKLTFILAYVLEKFCTVLLFVIIFPASWLKRTVVFE